MSIIHKIHKYLIILLFLFPISVAIGQDVGTAAKSDKPLDAAGWFQLAIIERQAERYSSALNALAKAEEMEFAPVRISFERARLEVLADDRDGAVSELEAVAASGFTAVGFITGDPLLSRLEGHEGYDALIAAMSVKAYPCEHDPDFSAFDFWVGEWDVHVAGGVLAGSNVIEQAEHGCVLTESWTSVGGGTGSSINYLDKITGEWVQVWNSASGSQINVRGGITDEGMLLTGTIHYVSNGTTAPFRGLWTPLPDGKVRQFFEQSSDDGETWSPWFEGFYSRKTAE
jgi:hypothetical protein